MSKPCGSPVPPATAGELVALAGVGDVHRIALDILTSLGTERTDDEAAGATIRARLASLDQRQEPSTRSEGMR